MPATIDRAGRLIIPKVIRDELGVSDGGDIDIELVDGGAVLSPPTAPKRVERRDGRVVIASEGGMPVLPDDMVRHPIEDTR